MAYPHETRNRPGGDNITYKKIAEGVSAVGVSATTVTNYTVDLPATAHRINVTLKATNPSHGLSVKIRPWLDKEQTIPGTAMAISAAGSGVNASSTALTVAATATGTAAFSGQVASSIGGFCVSPATPYGVQVRVYSATTVTGGTYDLTILAVPEN